MEDVVARLHARQAARSPYARQVPGLNGHALPEMTRQEDPAIVREAARVEMKDQLAGILAFGALIGGILLLGYAVHRAKSYREEQPATPEHEEQGDDAATPPGDDAATPQGEEEGGAGA